MRDRSERGSNIQKSQLGHFLPGDFIRHFARGLGWEWYTNNIVVEGDHDVRYVRLADRLYARANGGLRLCGIDMNVIAVGHAELGGVDAIDERLRGVRQNLQIDPEEKDGTPFKVLALLDDDKAGREVIRRLKGAGFQLYRDIIPLCRTLPRCTRDCDELERAVSKSRPAEKMDCEIEDLVDLTLIELFLETEPQSLQRPPIRAHDGFHHDFQRHAKAKFVKFVEDHADLEQIIFIVELLKSLRYLLKLDPDGVPPAKSFIAR